MVIDVKIIRKSEKIQEKKERHDVDLPLLTMLYGLCTFPNMVINRKITRNQKNSGEKEEA